MEALDGNAIAGPLFEYFGAEMTMARGTCSHCGATKLIGELRVFNRAPGSVARCPNCANVVIVVVTIHNDLRVELDGFRLQRAPGQERPPALRPPRG